MLIRNSNWLNIFDLYKFDLYVYNKYKLKYYNSIKVDIKKPIFN